ncbi:MAG: alpha/beta fold hydrolase [Deltaproteobacteria bacterium]|nr:alpha/beta fold hydrolase [Deltaproteobacteria bacterium]
MRIIRTACIGVWLCGTAAACDSASSTGDTVDDVAGDGLEEDGAVEAGDEDVAADTDIAADGEDEDEADVPPPPLEWGPCDTSDWPAGYPLPADGVECAALDVPLDYGDPSAGTIPLTVALHRSRHHPTGLAVFNLAGGPGGSSIAQSGIIPVTMPLLRADFDLVYVDQRGTGRSGYMGCPGGYPETRGEWEACAAPYASRDLNHYLTVDAAHDIDTVRERMGYERMYVRGGSYGTRLGLEVLRQHGDKVVAAVLDGLAPPDIDLFGDSIPLFDHGVDLLVAECDADPACLAVSPTLLDDLRLRREQLRATPRPVFFGSYPDVEDEAYYLMFLEAFLYDAYWRFDVPRAIHQAVLGDNTLWNALLSDLTGYAVTDRAKGGAGGGRPGERVIRERLVRHELAQDYVAPGVFITVVCAEWLPNSAGPAALRTMLADQEWPDDTHVILAEACAAWDVDPLSADLRGPVVSDVPTLLMNGELDLNTPAEWGPHAALTLPDSTSLLVPHATHATILVDCASQIMSRFLMADGAMATVDTSCLADIPHPGW